LDEKPHVFNPSYFFVPLHGPLSPLDRKNFSPKGSLGGMEGLPTPGTASLSSGSASPWKPRWAGAGGRTERGSAQQRAGGRVREEREERAERAERRAGIGVWVAQALQVVVTTLEGFILALNRPHQEEGGRGGRGTVDEFASDLRNHSYTVRPYSSGFVWQLGLRAQWGAPLCAGGYGQQGEEAG